MPAIIILLFLIKSTVQVSIEVNLSGDASLTKGTALSLSCNVKISLENVGKIDISQISVSIRMTKLNVSGSLLSTQWSPSGLDVTSNYGSTCSMSAGCSISADEIYTLHLVYKVDTPSITKDSGLYACEISGSLGSKSEYKNVVIYETVSDIPKVIPTEVPVTTSSEKSTAQGTLKISYL